jgi:hypothetical protein
MDVKKAEKVTNAILGQVMEYPKEALAQALMTAADDDPEFLNLLLLFTEWKRQRGLYEAEVKRFSDIPTEAVTIKRWRYHTGRIRSLKEKTDALEAKIDAALGIVPEARGLSDRPLETFGGNTFAGVASCGS